jgi:hypothetical protein
VELAAADRFHIGQRRPDKVFDPGCFGRLYRCGCLLKLVGTLFRKIGDQENAMGPCECGLEGIRAVEIRFDDLVGQSAVIGWMASQSAHLELALGLQGTYYSASLLPVAPITAINF